MSGYLFGVLLRWVAIGIGLVYWTIPTLALVVMSLYFEAEWQAYEKRQSLQAQDGDVARSVTAKQTQKN